MLKHAARSPFFVTLRVFRGSSDVGGFRVSRQAVIEASRRNAQARDGVATVAACGFRKRLSLPTFSSEAFQNEVALIRDSSCPSWLLFIDSRRPRSFSLATYQPIRFFSSVLPPPHSESQFSNFAKAFSLHARTAEYCVASRRHESRIEPARTKSRGSEEKRNTR